MYESERKYGLGADALEVVPLDRVWACYKREMPSKKKRHLLELFMDDGYLALVLDDPISLDQWYKEINDEIGQAKNTLRPHADQQRPNYAYNSHHQVEISKVCEVTDHYGFDEVESQNHKKSEIQQSLGSRWLCIEKDAIHVLKPVGAADLNNEKQTLKANKIEHSIKHDNILVFNRGKRGTEATPWVSIVFGQKDPIYSWHRKDEQIRKHWEERKRQQEQLIEEERLRRQHRILYEGENPFTSGLGPDGKREKIFQNPDELFPKEKGMFYIKLVIEVKDWDYARVVHEELKLFKSKLKERYIHAGSQEATMDTTKVAPGLRYRTFDTIDPAKLNEMTIEDLLSEKLRMETTRDNKKNDPIYGQLARLILSRKDEIMHKIHLETQPIQQDASAMFQQQLELATSSRYQSEAQRADQRQRSMLEQKIEEANRNLRDNQQSQIVGNETKVPDWFMASDSRLPNHPSDNKSAINPDSITHNHQTSSTLPASYPTSNAPPTPISQEVQQPSNTFDDNADYIVATTPNILNDINRLQVEQREQRKQRNANQVNKQEHPLNITPSPFEGRPIKQETSSPEVYNPESRPQQSTVDGYIQPPT